MKVSDSLDNVLNEKVVTHLGTDRPTNQLSDQLLELLEWLFATKNIFFLHLYTKTRLDTIRQIESFQITYKMKMSQLVADRG